MAQSVRVTDRMPQFKRSAYNVLDDALREGARDTLINSKRKAPFKKGHLRANTEAKQMKPLHWRVSYWMEYARFQHEGGTARRRVRRYSTPGTGKKFLEEAGNIQAKKIAYTFKKHGKRARA